VDRPPGAPALKWEQAHRQQTEEKQHHARHGMFEAIEDAFGEATDTKLANHILCLCIPDY